MSAMADKVQVRGMVAPGYENVRTTFAAHFSEGAELGAAFAVYHDGVPIIHLWGGHANAARNVDVTEHTVFSINSTSKALGAVAIAMLVDRGQLDFERPVSAYWPEFAAAGKEAITVGELMSHQAGLVGPRVPVTLEDFMEQRRVAALLADQEPFFKPGVWGYHALTIGTLADELVRRVDGRTLSRFFAEEVADPLGLGVFLGLPAAQDHRYAEVVGRYDPDALAFDAVDPACLAAAVANPMLAIDWANARPWREAGQSGAGACASAGGLARLFSLLVSHDLAHGTALISRPVMAEATRERSCGIDRVGGWIGRYGAGFRLNTSLWGSCTDAFGHAGAGGSVAFADPVRKVGIAYTPNLFSSPDWQMPDVRLMALLRAYYAAQRDV